jgi:type IV secretory pathway TrbL component
MVSLLVWVRPAQADAVVEEGQALGDRALPVGQVIGAQAVCAAAAVLAGHRRRRSGSHHAQT